MDQSLPFCMIFLNGSIITSTNNLFNEELKKIDVNPEDFTGDITNYIHEDIGSLYRTSSSIKIHRKVIICVLSYKDNVIFVEPSLCNSSFVRFINHELKTPLSSNIELLTLMSSMNLDQKQEKILSMLKSNSLVFAKSINNTMDYLNLISRKTQINKKKFYLKDMLSSVKSTVGNNKVIYPTGDIKLFTDQHKLSQIIVHVLNHCLEKDNVNTVVVKVRKKKEYIMVYIIDDGNKIDDFSRDTMFYGFLNISDDIINHKRYSSSLDMVISKSLAKLLGGDLVLQSTEDYGSTYQIHVEALDPEGSL